MITRDRAEIRHFAREQNGNIVIKPLQGSGGAGMFLVGLDIVGDKLMEINVFSPGGLGSAQKTTGVRFARPVLDALERKVQFARFCRRNFRNTEMATL